MGKDRVVLKSIHQERLKKVQESMIIFILGHFNADRFLKKTEVGGFYPVLENPLFHPSHCQSQIIVIYIHQEFFFLLAISLNFLGVWV
jgi:hypothetical protein